MFGISLGKLIVLIIILMVVWKGFKYIGRLQRIETGKRKPTERTMSERLRRMARGRKNGQKNGRKENQANRYNQANDDIDIIEDTEECPTCHAFISVSAQGNCNKPNCPY